MNGWRWRRREARHAQQDADRLDRALDGGPVKSFGREVAIARALASEITPVAEPPDAARVALRAGLGVHRHRRRHAVARAGFALATMAAAVAAILGVTLSGGPGNHVAVSAEANQAIQRLNASIKDLEAAVATGNLVEIQKQLVTAQAAEAVARQEAAALPAPSRELVMPAIDRSNEEITFLSKPAAVDYASTTPHATSTTAAPTTTGAPTTTQARHSSTTTSTSTPTSTSTSTSTSTTTPHGTTTSSTTPSTTTPPTTAPAQGAAP